MSLFHTILNKKYTQQIFTYVECITVHNSMCEREESFSKFF